MCVAFLDLKCPFYSLTVGDVGLLSGVITIQYCRIWAYFCVSMCVYLCWWECITVSICVCISVCLCCWECISVSICVYLCMSVCMYVFMRLCISVSICVCMCISVCISVLMRVHFCICVCMCVCIYVCFCVCISVCISLSTCVCVCISLCVCVCMYVCISVLMRVYLCIYVCTYVYIYVCMYLCVDDHDLCQFPVPCENLVIIFYAPYFYHLTPKTINAELIFSWYECNVWNVILRAAKKYSWVNVCF